METTTSDIRMSRRDREDQRFRLPSRERDDRPQTQNVNRGSRPRQRSPIDYDDMDTIPQGGATSSFGERRNITLRNSVPDIGPSPEIGFSLMSETRTKYDDRFMPTRDTRFRQPGSSPTMPTTAHREYFSPGPGNPYGFRGEFYRYPDEREPWVSGRNPYSRERERDRERERERERDRERRDSRTYRASNISSHFERDSQHDIYDSYRDRDYHRKRYTRDWDYRRPVSSGPGYRDDPHGPRYETSLPRGESGESERNGRYFMATRHNHWRQRDRRSSSPSTRSSITNSPPPPSHHRSRSTKASTRSVSPQTRSSTGNSGSSSPRRSDLERIASSSSKRPLKISIQKRVDNNSENEDETNQYKEQVEEPILHNGTEPSNVDKNLHTTGTAIHDETDLEEKSLKGSDEKSEGNEKGGWTGWRNINEEKEREQKKLRVDAADSETVTDQTADMDLSSGENDEQPSQSHLDNNNKLSVCTDELESMEESDAADGSVEYHVETSKKDNETVDVSINSNMNNNHINDVEPLNVPVSRNDETDDELDNHPDTLSSKAGGLTSHENRSLPIIPEVTHIQTSSSQYIVEGSSHFEDDKIDYNAIGAEIEKVENEIDLYTSLLEQKRKRIEEKNLARTNRKSKSNKRVNFDFHQEAILIEVEQTESANELTVNNIQNGENVFSEYMSSESDKIIDDYEEENNKPSTMWEIIYSENKEKTEDIPLDSLIRFGSWGQTNEIYKSLSEYPFFQQNILDYNRLCQLLMKDFQNQKTNIKQKELALQQEWKTIHNAWKQKFESLQKTKGKMKQDDNDGNSSTSGFAARWPVRTNRGRRRGDVVRSEAEMEEVMRILQDEQRKCQTWANVPSMILDPKERQQAKFINNNRCVSDPECFYDFNVDINVDWTTKDREDFYELFKLFPKKFGKIAEHFKDKSANDCVTYYYLNKKELKLKDFIPKNGRGQRMIALNSKAKKNNHLSPNNTQNIDPINFSGFSVINDSRVPENVNEGLATINEISEETNEISNKNIDRPSIETVAPLMEQPEPHKYSDFNEENPSEKSDLSMQQQQHNENVLPNVQKTQQPVNNPEPSHIQDTVEESSLPVVKKRTSKPSRRQKVAKDSDQQEEKPVKKRRNGPPSVDNDRNNNNNNTPVVLDAQNTQTSRKQSSINDDDIGVDEAARGLILMSLDGSAHDNNTQPSTQQELTSVSKGKGRPRQIDLERDNEVPSSRSSIVNDDRYTSQKKISSYWNKREVSLFEQSLNDFGKDFKKISDVIRSKTEVQVKNYYEKHHEKQSIGNNVDDVETRLNTSDDIQSSKEKQSQTKSTSRGNVSQNAQSQHHISINSQNDETALPFGPRPGFFSNTLNVTQLATDRQSQISESSSSLNRPSSNSVVIQSNSPSSETAAKSSISSLLNPCSSNTIDANDNSWFNDLSGEQTEMFRSNRNNGKDDSETVSDRRHGTTGTVSSDANIQNVISSIPRQAQPHFVTPARSNNHHQTQSLSQYPMLRKQQQQQQQQHFHMISNPQNQQASNISQRFRPTNNYYMQPTQQMTHQPSHQQVQQLHQMRQQRIPARNITSNAPPSFIMNNYLYAPYLLPPGNSNTVVGQQSANASHHITTTTGSSSASQHNGSVYGQIVGPSFNGTSHSSHLFTQTPQHQVRPHQSQVHYQQVLHRPLMNSNMIGRSTSSVPAMNELSYNGHILQTRPSMVMSGSPPGIVQGMQGVVHGHAHNFTDSSRPFSGDQQQPPSSERSIKIEPPS